MVLVHSFGKRDGFETLSQKSDSYRQRILSNFRSVPQLIRSWFCVDCNPTIQQNVAYFDLSYSKLTAGKLGTIPNTLHDREVVYIIMKFDYVSSVNATINQI